MIEQKTVSAIQFELGMPKVYTLMDELQKDNFNNFRLAIEVAAIYLASPSILRKYRNGNKEILDPIIEQVEELSVQETMECVNFFSQGSTLSSPELLVNVNTLKAVEKTVKDTLNETLALQEQ